MNKGISMVDTLRDFVIKMNDLGIEYMVTGSYAMSAYGEIRMTRDIDVVIELRARDADRFFKEFSDEYYISKESIQRALINDSMFNIISNKYGGKIDCIIKKGTDHAKQSFERRYQLTIGNIRYWITTKEDLMISKLNWARGSHSEMQIRDIANLTMSEYDSDYVMDWITKLGLEEIWAKVGEWKTLHSKTEN